MLMLHLYSSLRLSLALPTMTALLSVYYHDNIRDFLICSSREEDLRFDLKDFWIKEVGKKLEGFRKVQVHFNFFQDYNEQLTTFPWFHPFRILISILSIS